MKELEVLVSLVNKLIGLGFTNSAEVYAAEKAIEVLKEKLKEDDSKL